MFKPVFLEQFRQFHFLMALGYLYKDFKIRVEVTSAKKVTLRDKREDVDKIVSRYKKLLTSQVENLHEVSQFNK